MEHTFSALPVPWAPTLTLDFRVTAGWTTLIDWDDAASDAAVRAVSAETTALWAELGAARGSALDFVFLNDASRDQNPLASYGAENLAKLREIARAYDPEQVFQKLQNGGFLLSRA